jgi:hypothetical protein
MAGFQLAGPAADVSKILYSESRKLYGEPNQAYNTISPLPRISLVSDAQFSFTSVARVTVLFVWAPHTICDSHHTKF